MAIEYAGYIPTTKQVNWESLTDKFAEKVGTAISARKEERIALDKIAADNEKMINEQQLGQTQAVGEFITREGFKGKNFINGLNKELKLGHITPQQYKVAMNNVTENWGMLAATAKTYDEKRQELFKRQQPDPETGLVLGAGLEVKKQELYEEALDMKSNSTQWSQNGNLSLAKLGPNGEIIQLNDVRSLVNPENILVNKNQVLPAIKIAVKGLGDFKRFFPGTGGASTTVEGMKNNGLYNQAANSIVSGICPDGNDTQMLSAGADNGIIKDEISYIFNDDERQLKIEEISNQLRQQKIDAGLDRVTADEEAKIRADLEKENSTAKKKLTADEITKKFTDRTDLLKKQKTALLDITDAEKRDIEVSVVKLVKDSYGVINPVLTDDQKKYIKEGVRTLLDVHVQDEISGTGKEVFAPRSGNPSGAKTKVNNYETYKLVTDAIANNDVSTLNAMSLGKYQYVINKDGLIDKYKIGQKTIDGVVSNVRQLVTKDLKVSNALSVDFVKGSDPAGDWRQQELLYNKDFPAVTGGEVYTGKIDPKTMKVVFAEKKVKPAPRKKLKKGYFNFD
jgi:hypothetical protein